jgi:hypothetical protein
MQLDFAAVRRLLEAAQQHVPGTDSTSEQVREALDLLIGAAMTAEHSRSEVVPFVSRP